MLPGMLSVAARTPADVLRLIFELLEQPDVLATAAVSRTWRATAVRDHSYYRAWVFFSPPRQRIDGSSIHNSNILDLVPVVRDAERRRYKLRLTLQHDGVRAQGQIVPVVRFAIPHLVRLDINVQRLLAPPLLDALDVPAPNLRDLSIGVFQPGQLEESSPLPPGGLFAGHAPLLASVNLSDVQLREQMPCFPSVRQLHLNFHYIAGQLRLAADCFPQVQELRLSNFLRSPGEHRSAEELRLYRQLDYLDLGPDLDAQNLVAALPAIMLIPEIDFRCKRNTQVLAPLLCTPAPSILSISEIFLEDPLKLPFSYLRLQVESPQTVRRMDVDLAYDATFRILGEASVAATLTKVFIDDRHVRSLMTTYRTMPLLEELTINVIAWCTQIPGSWPEPVTCSCPYPVSRFAGVDTRPPDDSLAVDWPRLSTVFLRAMHADATVGGGVLQALAQAIGGPRIVLKNGLSVAGDVLENAQPSRSTVNSQFVHSADTARVSRRWRVVATREPNYYRSVTFSFLEKTPLEPFAVDFSGFKCALQDAEALQYPLGLYLCLDNSIEDEGADTADLVQLAGGEQWLVQNIIHFLRRALPHLALLGLAVSSPFGRLVLGELLGPIVASIEPIRGETRLIQEVILSELVIPATAPLVFAGIHTLRLFYTRDQSLSSLHTASPSVRHLKIASFERNVPLDETDFVLVDGLESLVLEDGVEISILSPVLRAYPNLPFLEFKDKETVRGVQLLRFLGYTGPIELALAAHTRSSGDGESFLSSHEAQLWATLCFCEYGLTHRVA
ncbi:hypothetical protein AURDEDRAFT_163443 [Auricularia subglabra TFB-10046 SS5]|nr:hypothetical protein AURDEDRAFT_163443 [Auricularia subglabra TFB-10046 SS5]